MREKRIFVLGLFILSMAILVPPVVANNQGLEWGVDIGDRFYFHYFMEGDDYFMFPYIDELYFADVDGLDTVPDDIQLMGELPNCYYSTYYLNGSIASESLFLLSLAMPIGNWTLLSEIISMGSPDDFTIIDTETEWGFEVEFTITYTIDYTIKYYKTDGVLSLFALHYEAIEGDETYIGDIETRRDMGPPELSHPADISYNAGEFGNEIHWDFDEENPTSYQISRNGVPIDAGSLNSQDTYIEYDVDGLPYGTYSFTVTLEDVFGNFDTDTVLVTVNDITPPDIEGSEDLSFSQGELGHSVEWQIYDVNPDYYEIYENGELVDTDVWISDADIIEINLDEIPGGYYNYTLIVYDKAGNHASDSVVVVIENLFVILLDPRTLLTIGSVAVIVVFGGLIARDRMKGQSSSSGGGHILRACRAVTI
jgi:hypothetical protein